MKFITRLAVGFIVAILPLQMAVASSVTIIGGDGKSYHERDCIELGYTGVATMHDLFEELDGKPLELNWKSRVQRGQIELKGLMSFESGKRDILIKDNHGVKPTEKHISSAGLGPNTYRINVNSTLDGAPFAACVK